MKKYILLIVLTVSVMACGGKTEKGEESGKVDLVNQYLAIKDALVSTDAAKAQKAAEAFLSVNTNDKLTSALKAMAGSNDVSVQRKAFELLSENMYSFVKTSGSNTTLYKQFCPMAFNNKGAYWLAKEKQVNNPYFGDRMLHCGSVQEVLGE